MVQCNKIIGIRRFWWSSAVFILALCSQIPIEASNRPVAETYDLNFMPAPADTTVSQPRTRTGKLSRRAKAALKRTSFKPLETKVEKDTSSRAAILEAIRALPRDSSARMAQFTYVRRDKPNMDGRYHKEHPLFLATPPVVKYQDELDTARMVYRLRRTFDNTDSRIPTEIPLEDYSTLRLKQSVRQNWESLSQTYKLETDSKMTLGDVMGKITKIEVPIPKNPIFSIFGPSIVKLNVNGSINIEAGFSSTKYDAYQASALGQTQSTPTFKQEITVNANGEIGDKLKIDADWNTQRTFEYENQLHVKYTGYEDEIVQSVEAGNVSLPTNSSFISGGSALFGIMAKFQLGPLRLTTVATQKKGQSKESSVPGGSTVKSFEIRPTAYSINNFFVDTSYERLYESVFLENKSTGYKKIREIEVWVSNILSITPTGARNILAFMSQDSVERIQRDTLLRKAAYSSRPGEVEQGFFVKLNSTDYDVNYDAGIITLKAVPADNQAIAVYYVTGNPDDSPRYIGNSGLEQQDTSSSMKCVMKLIRPRNLGSEMPTAWSLMLKNRYSLAGITGIEQSSLIFNMEYQIPGQTPQQQVFDNISLMALFGLDLYIGNTNTRESDNIFDYIAGKTIDAGNGEIIFPTIEPFSTASIYKFLTEYRLGKKIDTTGCYQLADSLSFPNLYSSTTTVATNDIKNRYYFRGSVKGASTNTFSFESFNAVEGSVVVTSGGQTLNPGTDYTVDYVSGRVVIRNPIYLAAGRDIQIKYETNDVFQLASKSLLGARGEFNLGKNSLLGFTMMNYSQQSLSDKVRVGEEPISNMMLGADGRTLFETPWLTNALNYIPGMKTTAPSQISLSGEVAYLLPNPNTRTSPISSDGSKGVAFIDDFEGSRQAISLGESYTQWTDASAPWYSSTLDTAYIPLGIDGKDISTKDDALLNGIMSDVKKMEYKGRACWFNINPSDVSIPLIWGDRKSYATGEGSITALNFYFRPQDRGAFNYSMALENTIGGSAHKKSWGGMQHILGTTATNLVDQNITFIELWIQIIERQDNAAKFNIDLGYISEDVIPNPGVTLNRNTEDGLQNTDHNIRTGTLDRNFDWGLDTMNDATERIRYAAFIEKYPQYAADPSGDDGFGGIPPQGGSVERISDGDRFDRANGTENNFDVRPRPDDEDLNGDGTSNRSNSYFEYEIPLDSSNTDFTKYVTGEGLNGWRQIRIPLVDYKRKIGEPTLTNVEGIRVWVTGASQPMLFRVVDFNLVGNQWEKRVKTDSSFDVSVVNVEDDPNYHSPPGVTQQRDIARADQNILGNEQSLNIIVKNLKDGENKEVVRWYTSHPLDMFNYRTLKMFIHGETGNPDKKYYEFKITDTSHDAEVFMRFGDDFSNYYEYRAPVHSGWEGNDIVIKFSELTALKASRDSANVVTYRPVPNGPTGAKYGVLGKPRLDKIQFISIGIENPDSIGAILISGELWANELRLTDVDDTPGWAYKFDAKIALADFANIAFSITEKNPFFHQLEERFGSRTTTRSWTLSTDFNLAKFLPDSWQGSSLSVGYSHSESMSKPRYISNSDILVEDAAQLVAKDTSTSSTREYLNADDVRLKTEDLTVTNSFTLPSIKLVLPVKSPFVTETINKLTFGYSYSNSHKRNPTNEYDNSWNWNAKVQYGTDFSKDNYLSPFSLAGDFFLLRPWKDFKVFFTPQKINFDASLNRSQSVSKARSQLTANPVQRSLTSQRSFSFDWQFFEGGLFDFGMMYSVNISSDLTHLETEHGENVIQRPFSTILGDIFFSDRLINFGIDKNYGQSISFRAKPAAPKILSLDQIFTPKMDYSVNYNWMNNQNSTTIYRQTDTLFGIGKQVGWTSNPSFGLDVNLKPISDALWSSGSSSQPVDTGKGISLRKLSKLIDPVTRVLFKYPIFDFEKLSFSFSQSNKSDNAGVRGSTGFANIFARVPFFQNSLVDNGPSLLYQLGFITDPNGWLVLKTKGTFPFITGYTVPGLRMPKLDITDSYSQSNTVAMQTSRSVFEGVTLDLKWNVGWDYAETRNIRSDDIGRTTVQSMSVTKSFNRSYISLPPILMFKYLKTDLENVNKKFEELRRVNDGQADKLKLSQAFEEGMEAFPWITKILGPLAPRANWTIRWSGLENFSFFKSFTKSVSLDHSYTSTYSERSQSTQSGGFDITSQSITSGFAPLIGISFVFKELMKGNLDTKFSYASSSTYNLVPSNFMVEEVATSAITVGSSFSRQGFEIPFLGLSLQNNIDIRIDFSLTHNATLRYDFNHFSKDGSPVQGDKTVRINPTINYSMSERVTLGLFYSYTKITPDEGGSLNNGRTENVGKLTVTIAIK